MKLSQSAVLLHKTALINVAVNYYLTPKYVLELFAYYDSHNSIISFF